MEKLNRFAFTAEREWAHYVAYELEASHAVVERYGDLFLVGKPVKNPFWAKNHWLECYRIPIESINDAAKKLRSLGRNWAPYSFQHFRRMALIQEKLPMLPSKPKTFPFDLPNTPMGAWALLDENTILASPVCSSPFPSGEALFVENKTEAPSRAYLKLYEAISLCKEKPHSGDFCIDIGSSPGGWTWVLANLGATVLSADRSPLEDRLMKHPRIKFRQGNAFALKPDDFDHVDWLCSDIICYPEKLFEWLQPWIASNKVRHFICTIKMQGEPDWTTIQRFSDIPNSRVIHLHNNKHELTWIR